MREDQAARERLKGRFADLLPQPHEVDLLVEELHRAIGPPGAHVRLVPDGKAPFISPALWGAMEQLTGKPFFFSFVNKPSNVNPIDWWLGWVRAFLPLIWDTPDLRVKESLVLGLLRAVPGFGLWLVRPRYVPSPFEQVLIHFFKSADKARHCGNPDCLTPYFIASRRSQKYCSDTCAAPAQREFKRRWWAEHGEARRKARKRSAKKSQRKLGK
jgi:hypothetical protein